MNNWIKSLARDVNVAEGLRRMSLTKLELAMENWLDYRVVPPDIRASVMLPAAITVEGLYIEFTVKSIAWPTVK